MVLEVFKKKDTEAAALSTDKIVLGELEDIHHAQVRLANIYEVQDPNSSLAISARKNASKTGRLIGEAIRAGNFKNN